MKMNRQWITVGGGLAVVAVLALVLLARSSADPWAPHIGAAQAVVTKAAMVPDSVEFPPLGDASYNVDERSGGVVEVTGRVSMLNALRVRLTQPWRVVLRDGEPVEVEVGRRKLR